MDSTSQSRRLTGLTRWFVGALVICLSLGFVAQASAATFVPESIISNANMRDYDSMSKANIQAFLEAQPGLLDTLVTTDYAGVEKRASTIIWEACREWKINPKVMLVMLQKEQSLLTRTTLAKNTLSRTIGAGCPNATTNRYPGFGQQMWNGARMLDSYGQTNPSFPTFTLGMSKTIYKIDGMTHIHPSNLATFKLYVYNPSIGVTKPYGDLTGRACSGNANFWKLYRTYFGSTYTSPRMQRVFSFRNKSTGSYLFTTSVTERYHLGAKHKSSWTYKGVSFSVDTSATSSTVPVYRFYNKKTHKYSFTRSATKYKARRTKTGRKTWTYSGVAFRVSAKKTEGSITVYRMHNKKTGAYLLTQHKTTVASLRSTKSQRKIWESDGVAWYLPRVVTP